MSKWPEIAAAALGASLVFTTACQKGDSAGQVWSSRPVNSASLAVIDAANLYDASVGILAAATDSENALVRANAIEALQLLPDRAEVAARAAILDPNRGVRFVGAFTIGMMKYDESAHLLESLLDDSSESVRAAAIFALRQCGHRVNLTPLAAMLRSTNAEVRGNAALVLGELRDSSSAAMVRQAIGRPLENARPSQLRIVDLQIAEALVKLGDREQLHSIRAALYLPAEYHEIAAMAARMCGELGDFDAIGSLKRLLGAAGDERRPAELRLAAATALAQLGEQIPVSLVREYLSSPRPELRAQVAHAMGRIGDRSITADLAELLDDPNPLVQVSAAEAIVRLDRR